MAGNELSPHAASAALAACGDNSFPAKRLTNSPAALLVSAEDRSPLRGWSWVHSRGCGVLLCCSRLPRGRAGVRDPGYNRNLVTSTVSQRHFGHLQPRDCTRSRRGLRAMCLKAAENAQNRLDCLAHFAGQAVRQQKLPPRQVESAQRVAPI